MISESELKRRQKISKTMKTSSKVKRGKDHPFWKGDDVSYFSLHEWLTKYKPKVEYCEDCGKKKKLDIANISGEYKRDVDDYKWLCRSCHKKKDFNYETFDGGFKIRPLSFWKDKKMPEFTKQKMSESQKKRPPMSDETKERIRISNTGKYPSEESRLKMRNSRNAYIEKMRSDKNG